MAKTVGTLAYQIVADTRNFTQGMVLTKNELKATKAIMEESITPVGRLSNSIGNLNTLYDKGAISTAHYAKNLLGIVGAGTIAAASIHAVGRAVNFTTGKIKEQYEEIDNLINHAENISVGVGVFQEMAAAAKLVDIELGETAKGMESMLAAVSKGAASKTGDLKGGAFATIGLDAKKLKDMQPVEILRNITAGLDNLTNSADRVRIAKQIFGDADFLRLDLADLELAEKLLDAMGGRMDELDAANFDEMDASAKKLEMSLDIVWQKLALALTPAITAATDGMSEFVIESSKAGEVAGTFNTISNAATGVVGGIKDMTAALVEFVAAHPAPGVLEGAFDAVSLGGMISNLEKMPKAGFSSFDPSTGEMSGSIAAGQAKADYNKSLNEYKQSLAEEKEATTGGSYIEDLRAGKEKDAADLALVEYEKALKAETANLKGGSYIDDLMSGKVDKDEFDYGVKEFLQARQEEEQIGGGSYIDDLRNGKQQRQRQAEFRNPAMLRGSQEAIAAIANAKLGNQNQTDKMVELLEGIEENTAEESSELPVIPSFGGFRGG